MKKILDLLADPKVLKHVHGYMVFVWIILLFPTLVWWKSSILWVALMSVWANIAGHWAAWQAARAEVNQNSEQE